MLIYTSYTADEEVNYSSIALGWTLEQSTYIYCSLLIRDRTHDLHVLPPPVSTPSLGAAQLAAVNAFDVYFYTPRVGLYSYPSLLYYTLCTDCYFLFWMLDSKLCVFLDVFMAITGSRCILNIPCNVQSVSQYMCLDYILFEFGFT